MEKIKLGRKSTNMDDRWHAVSSQLDDEPGTTTVSLHRSWTGFEVFRASIRESDDDTRASNVDCEYELFKFAYNADTSQYRPNGIKSVQESMLFVLDDVFGDRQPGIVEPAVLVANAKRRK